jgi:two-component system sensor histidine kinase PilS (NtrC family)
LIAHRQSQPAIPTTLDIRQRGGLLQVYAWYRVVISLALLALFFTDYAWNKSPTFVAQLYLGTTATYCAINFISLVAHGINQFRTSSRQLFAIVTTDIIALSLITYASGGLNSGLVSLLLIPVAAGAIFFYGNVATVIAAIASVGLITQVTYAALQRRLDAQDFLNTGLVGALLFATSLLVQFLSRRIRSTQLIAEQQSAAAASLEQLNQIIIQRMRTGIIVVADNGIIKMMNAAAARLADLDSKAALAQHMLTGPLRERLAAWKQAPNTRTRPFRSGAAGIEVQANFTSLDYGSSLPLDTLIFLEDTSVVSQQAQQLKLASLGRLTASIAHEIRNPLGAISHAAQLLRESPVLDVSDTRLADIIQSHSKRVNTIIENVLQLSRRRTARPERIMLDIWISHFREELLQSHTDADITATSQAANIAVRFDTSQLHQILTNLCENGLRHSRHSCGAAKLLLRIGMINDELPVLDVIDEGRGIPKETQERIFEPFFTTEKTGTGLGLFLSRELCEANQARLDYRTDEQGRTCFRISFAHPDKNISHALADTGTVSNNETDDEPGATSYERNSVD